MKRTIRKGVFETNSSSIHTLVISHSDHIVIPEEIYFDFGEYGWGYDELYSPQDRANYLYTYICSEYDDNYDWYEEHGYSHPDKSRTDVLKHLENILHEIGVKNCIFRKPRNEKYSFDCGCIDHSRELYSFFEPMLDGDIEALKNWLFNNDNFIILDSDNDDNVENYPDIPDDWDTYVKGN